MIYLLNRIIKGLNEETHENDATTKAIVDYFARIDFDGHPDKSIERLNKNSKFKPFFKVRNLL